MKKTGACRLVATVAVRARTWAHKPAPGRMSPADSQIGPVWRADPLDTAASTGRLMLSVIAAVGQAEREAMLERQREGVAKAKRTASA